MWKNVCATLVFLCGTFAVCRLRELMASSTGLGYLPSREVNPASLTTLTLREVLDHRGINHTNIFLKQGLEQLAAATGNTTEIEVLSASATTGPNPPVNYVSGKQLQKDLQDAADAVWLLHVGYRFKEFLSAWDWHTVTDRVSKSGIRTGYIDCNLDQGFCDGKGWFSPRLVMVRPQRSTAKRTSLSYRGKPQTHRIIEWVHEQMASTITRIRTASKLEKEWLDSSDPHQNKEVRVILISPRKSPPLFYSVLCLMFEDSVQFGIINAAAHVGQVILSSKNWTRIPSYKIITPECEYDYGELSNYMSMRLFLQTIQPSSSDTFFLLLIFINVSCCLSMAFTNGDICERLGGVVWSICKWNLLYYLLWFPTELVLRLPYMDTIRACGLKVIRLVSLTQPVSLVRADYLGYYEFYSLSLFFMIYSLVVGILYHAHTRTDIRTDGIVTQPHFSSTATDTRPTSSSIATDTRPTSSSTPTGTRPTFSSTPTGTRPTSSSAPTVTRPSFGVVSSETRSNVGVTSSDMLQESNNRLADANNMALFDADAIRMFHTIHQRILAGIALNNRYLPSLPVWRHAPEYIDTGSSANDTGFATHGSTSEPELPPDHVLPTEQCTICLETVLSEEVLCALPCGHAFHDGCIKRWLRPDNAWVFDNNHLCPLCRESVFADKQ